MRDITENEIDSISGGVIPYLAIGAAFVTAVAISDGFHSFAAGYRAAMAD